MKAKCAEICEFRRTNCELFFQTKKRRNLGASIVLTSAKFRKQGEESKRNFVAKFRACRTKMIVINWRNEFSFRRHEISLRWGEISSSNSCDLLCTVLKKGKMLGREFETKRTVLLTHIVLFLSQHNFVLNVSLLSLLIFLQLAWSSLFHADKLFNSAKRRINKE